LVLPDDRESQTVAQAEPEFGGVGVSRREVVGVEKAVPEFIAGTAVSP